MTDMILSADVLPEPLSRMIRAEKVRVSETDGVVILSPMEGEINYIDELFGSCADGKLTVEKFLEWTREDKDIEA